MTTLEQLLKNKIVAIFRGVNPDDVLRIGHALYDGGVRLMEITLNSPKALTVIREATGSLPEDMLVGAGTVLNVEQVLPAIQAGAKFIISPVVDEEVIRVTKELGGVSIPGAFTPTEIARAHQMGGDIIKIFPGILGAKYVKELKAPLEHIPMMPTGGIHAENIREFYQAGAAVFGIGRSLVDATQKITEQYLQEITEHAKKLSNVVSP